MFFTIIQYLKYYFVSLTKYKIHSPFVYSFIIDVLEKKLTKEKKTEIADLLSYYKTNNLSIKNEDYGAGSKVANKETLSIKHLLKNVATSKKYGKILFNIVNKYKIKNSLELGTSLGFGTLYLHNNENKITTIEGNKDLANISANAFNQLNINNIEMINEVFDNVLEDVLLKNNFDLIFIDGNHKEEATLRYFNLVLKYKNKNSVIIFDDINWSKGMNNAWNKIIKNKEILLSIDLFKFGIVFFNDDFLVKEHFILWH